MFKILAITLTLHALANSQSFEQIWQIKFPSLSKTDTIRIIYQQNPTLDYTVFESLASSEEPYSISHYSFDPDSGYKWIENYKVCDSVGGPNDFQSECRVINGTPLRNISFMALGNLGYGTPIIQCAHNKNCKQHIRNLVYSTNTTASSWGWKLDSSSQQFNNNVYYRYGYMAGGSIYHGDGIGIMDSAIFSGDSICIQFSYGTYGRSDTNYFSSKFFPAIEGFRISQSASAIASHFRSKIPNSMKVFFSVNDFRFWMSQNSLSTHEIFNAFGQKTTIGEKNRFMYIRHESRIYRVILMK